jgi:hypothetical protein
VKELVYGEFGRITKEIWAKAEDHVLKIEKEYGKENCIDRSKGLSKSGEKCSRWKVHMYAFIHIYAEIYLENFEKNVKS